MKCGTTGVNTIFLRNIMTREDLHDLSTCWEWRYAVCDVTFLKQYSELLQLEWELTLLQVHLFCKVNVVGKFMTINNSKVIRQWDIPRLPAYTGNMTTSQSSVFRKRPTQNMFNCVQLEGNISICRWCNRKKFSVLFRSIQAGLILCKFSLCNFILTWLENLHHFLNLFDNFRFNMIWPPQSMATLVLCWRLAGSYSTVMPSVTCMDWFHWWCNHAAHVVPFNSNGFCYQNDWEMWIYST